MSGTFLKLFIFLWLLKILELLFFRKFGYEHLMVQVGIFFI